MNERAPFRLELFSRGGDPKFPVERVFELPCPGFPADARVFGVIHSDSPDVTSTLASLIRNAMVSIQTLNRRTLNSGLDGKFEAILLAVNRGYAELVASGTLPAGPLPDALLGLIVDRELFLTGRGAVEAYLFRSSEGEAPKNLFDGGENHGESPALFRTILSGTLKSNDVMLVTVSALFNFLAIPHLTRVLAENPARDARTRVLELLGDVSPAICLSGIIVGAPPEDVKKDRRFAPFAKNTKPDEPEKTRPQSAQPLAGVKRLGGLMVAGAGRGGHYGNRFLHSISRTALGFGRGLGRLTLNRDARAGFLKRIKNLPEHLINRWNGLPRRSRVLFIALILLAVFFGEGLRFMIRSRVTESRTSDYNRRVAEIQTKRVAAEASLIYKNEERAWSELAEAEVAAKALPARTDAEKKTVADLLAQIETDREKLRHLARLDSAAPLVSLPPEAGVGVKLVAGGNLLTIASDKGGAYNWDLAKKSLAPAVAPFLLDGAAKDAMLGSRGLLFFTGKNMVERVATSTQTTPVTLPGNASAATVRLWNGKLYALAPAARQIYRGTKSGASYNLATAALKTALADLPTDFAVDGSIWVAVGGAIKNYLAGNEQAYDLKPIDPAPKKITRVWANADGTLILFYDSDLKRVFVAGRDGSFKGQYAGGPIDDFKDLAFSEKTKTLWILTSRALFETPLPQ